MVAEPPVGMSTPPAAYAVDLAEDASAHNRAKGRLVGAPGSVYRRVMAAALLLADAEPETRGFLERHLPGDGFELVPAHGRFDLVLAGDVEGVDRWLPRAPVIVLGREEADTVDCIHAFRRGCDDYVTRPFEYQELVERIRAVLRRAAPRTGEVVEAAPVRIDTRTREVRVNGQRLQLAQKEYELLLCLAREPERVFTKAELLHDVWGYRTIGRTRTLDSHASRLRRKLRAAGSPVALIENVWGVGYRLVGELPLE
jgi:DNA-binding response OmpR family regulator